MKLPIRLLNRFELWIVPLLLASVALNQMRLAKSSNLSPWKGGGFGMFGSTDDPGQRFVGARAEGADGKPVDIALTWPGGNLSKNVARRLRCFPDQPLLDFAADRMVRSPFILRGTKKKTALATLRSMNPEASIPVEPKSGTPEYRLWTSSDPSLESLSVVRLKKLKLRMWRLRFDCEKASVRVVPMNIDAEAEGAVQ